jgi:hypothetical protein
MLKNRKVCPKKLSSFHFRTDFSNHPRAYIYIYIYVCVFVLLLRYVLISQHLKLVTTNTIYTANVSSRLVQQVIPYRNCNLLYRQYIMQRLQGPSSKRLFSCAVFRFNVLIFMTFCNFYLLTA